MPLDLLLRSNLVHPELSRMNINSLSLLDKTVQVTPQVIQTKRTRDRNTKEDRYLWGSRSKMGGEVEQNLEQESLSVEKHVEESWRVNEKKRHKNSGSRVFKEMAVFRKKTWSIKFCPGSLDG